MTVKKKYAVGDTVWIYGISKNNVKSTQGIVIKIFTIDYGNYNKEPQYLVEVPTEIEPLLEVRTWHTISQSKDGHVGSVREVFSDPDASHKMLARTGMAFISTDEELNEVSDRFEEHMAEEDEVSPEEIHAAMLRSQQSVTVPSMSPPKSSKRRYYTKKN
jgi:hypothetical protein